MSTAPPTAAATLRVEVNGRDRDVPATQTVATLVAELAPEARLVAVERNGRIVPRASWAETTLAEGDHLEIVRFVQGG